MREGGVLDLVGSTPMVRLRRVGSAPSGIRLFAKLESHNPTGSVKDRPASYIVRKLLENREISRETTLIESSSGNFGVALAAICRARGIRFVCVVDPLILDTNEFLMKQFGAEVVKVERPDPQGGYLQSRLAVVEELVREIPNSRWVDQYANPYAAQAHYFGTGLEIYEHFRSTGLDYAFVAVSSGGTITGVSQLLKEHFPTVRVIAVDVAGSVIFGGPPAKRHIPGMGSSITPSLLAEARIDEVAMVSERDIVQGCLELVAEQGLFVGGSSGAVYRAACDYFKSRSVSRRYLEEVRSPAVCDDDGEAGPNAVLVFADRGERYTGTIYDAGWRDTALPSEWEDR